MVCKCRKSHDHLGRDCVCADVTIIVRFQGGSGAITLHHYLTTMIISDSEL